MGKVLELEHATVALYPATFNVLNRLREGGREVPAERKYTRQHAADAEEIGYPGTPAGVWQALAEHELLHWLLWEWWLGAPSAVMLHEAGVVRWPLYRRWHEEALVLAFQAYLNTGEPDPVVLGDFHAADLEEWANAFAPCRRQVLEAWAGK